MTINRIADVGYDKENPAHGKRALATGALSTSFAWIFTFAAVVAFFIAAWQLNPLALKLAPVALAILFFLLLHQALHSLGRIFSWGLRSVFLLQPLGSQSPAILMRAC